MTRQTLAQINARDRQNYLRPGMKEKRAIANRKWYEKKIASDGECKPDYGLAFKSAAVQITLTNWGR